MRRGVSGYERCFSAIQHCVILLQVVQISGGHMNASYQEALDSLFRELLVTQGVLNNRGVQSSSESCKFATITDPLTFCRAANSALRVERYCTCG
jgi:hypothetical protein